MHIDPFTVMLFGLLLRVLLGGMFLTFWWRAERAPWFAWWSASFMCGAATTMLFLFTGINGQFTSSGIGTTFLVLASACCWQGARAFDHRRAMWLPFLLAPLAWLGAALTPGFLEETAYRVVLSSALIAPFLAMTAFEFWRGRAEALPSRWPVIVLFALFAMVFGIRIPLVDVLPFPFGALPMEARWLGAFNLLAFFHTVLLAVLTVAMTKERLELEQRTKAQTDPLTGAMNRHALEAKGIRLIQRHRHDGAPFCLMFLDLDQFKSLNDRFGHLGGDDVLIRFVAVAHNSIRPTDFLFRIGGEEFCCLLPHTNASQAHRVAERVRHAFECASVDIAGMAVKATVSVGIASSETFGYDLDILMRRADAAVYAAKRRGRNQVAVATGEDTEPVTVDISVARARLAAAS
jgi:diguanylate cyclase (GGDEF)-like protein